MGPQGKRKSAESVCHEAERQTDTGVEKKTEFKEKTIRGQRTKLAEKL